MTAGSGRNSEQPHCELEPSQKFAFIPKHHAQRPDAKGKKKETACQTSIATHPRSIRERGSRSSPPIPKDRQKRLHSGAARISIINQVGE
jgi:hypothetical protein